MSGAILPFPQYALMAWCSVKAQGQLYLTFIYTFLVSSGSRMGEWGIAPRILNLGSRWT
jgi:hypothetical protein